MSDSSVNKQTKTSMNSEMKTNIKKYEYPDDDEDSITSTDEVEPPDGGYGWVVCAAACTIHTIAIGYNKSFSLLFNEIMIMFPDNTAYQLSWILVLMNTISFLQAPLTGKLTQKFGGRLICSIGGVTTFVALFSASFATTLIPLTLSLGMLLGIGIGLCTVPTVLTVSAYFKKRRSLASAFCVCGNALGGFIMPPIVQFLIKEYTFKGCLLIFSALMLNVVVCALFFRPLPVKDKNTKGEKHEKEELLNSTPINNKLIVPQISIESADPEDRKYNKSKLRLKNSTNDSEFLKQELAIYRCATFAASMTDLRPRRNSSTTNRDVLSKCSKHGYNCSAKDLTSFNKFIETNTLKESNSAYQLTYSNLNKSESKVNSPNDLKIKPALHVRCLTLREEAAQFEYQFNKPKIILETADNIEIKLNEPDNNKAVFCKKKTMTNLPKSCLHGLANFFDGELLRSPKMIAMILSSGLVSMGGPHVFLTYLHAHFRLVDDIDSATATTLLSICSICDLVGRLSSGALADRKLVSIPLLYFCCLCLSGASALALPWLTSFPLLCLALGGYGIGIGAWVVLVPTVLANNHGIEKLPASYGFNRMSMGISNLISPQIMGGLADISGAYLLSYSFAGTCLILSAIVQLKATLPDLSFKCLQKHKQNEVED